MLIGADGVDLHVLNKLIAKKRLPTFAKLMKQGAHGQLLSEREMRSPALWTTIATGRPRSVHGIYDFVTGSRLWPKDQRSSKRTLVTSKMRKVPAIWNYASQAKQKVAVVGWLNTWPAEKVEGIMVSPYVAIGRSKQITIKGNVYPDEPYQVAPESRWREVRSLITTPEDITDDMVGEFAEEPDEALLKDMPIMGRYMDGLRWSLAHTMTMKDITLHLLKNDHPDLTMVYFEGADSLGHRFWLFRQKQKEVAKQLKEGGYSEQQAEALIQKYGAVVERYYVFLDAVIAELLEAFPEHGRVILVSDHGFTKRSGQYPVSKSVPFTGEHRLEGTIIAAGPGITPGKTIFGATLYDVTPTLMDMLKLSVQGTFEGRSLFTHLRAEKPAQVAVPSGAHEANDTAEVEINDESYREKELERLRSLGYVQ